ncbi:hypothetical protein A2U01_0104880, partial [Trifolium medium]|nr:hypothetical protein [Trifolium medium]
ITGPDSYIGHPFVITALCRLDDVPIWEDTDEIAPAERPLGRTFFQRAVRIYGQLRQQQQHHSHHHSRQHSRSS